MVEHMDTAENDRPLPVAGSRALIVGLGVTGLSCARFLSDLGIEVAVTDTREQPPQLDTLVDEFPDMALFLGGFPLDTLHVPDLVVISPGVSVNEPFIVRCVERGAELVGDVELFARAIKTPVVAITGSNGKSTVTELIGRMARRAGVGVEVGGNIGVPALELLKRDHAELYVLELSSFQLETTHSLNAAVATVLNISADHLDRYADMAAYTAAKQRVFRGDGVMVLNSDDQQVSQWDDTDRPVVWFGLSEPGIGEWGIRTVGTEVWLCNGERELLPVSDLKIKGRQNIANALVALAIGDAIDLGMAPMLDELRSFGGLEHRMQWVAEIAGVSFFNDSKATNVGATLAALEGLEGKTVLIAGGDSKGADLSPLASVVARKARAVVLIGRDADLLEAVLDKQVPVARAEDMNAAVRFAASMAETGDSVLLSPACASLDMYHDYAERGRSFVAAIKDMKA